MHELFQLTARVGVSTTIHCLYYQRFIFTPQLIELQSLIGYTTSNGRDCKTFAANLEMNRIPLLAVPAIAIYRYKISTAGVEDLL